MAFNRLNDLYFKQLLGDERRKDLTLCFLNDILERDGNGPYTDILFKDKDIEPDGLDGKLSKLDICAKLNDGSLVDIEVQVAARRMMFERVLYYWSNLYGSELPSGSVYTNIGKTISIILTNFDCLHGEENWHTPCYITSANSGRKLTDYFAIHFLELPKFQFKDIMKLRRAEWWMAYFSNRCTEKEMETMAVKDKTIQKVLEYETYFKDNPEERRKYELREKAIRDYNSDMQENRELGREEGHAKGLEEGHAKGLEEGRAEGEHKKAKAVVFNMLRLGMDMEQIIAIAEVTRQEAEALRQEWERENERD